MYRKSRWKYAYLGHKKRSNHTYGKKRIYHLDCARNVRFKQRKLTKREKRNIWNDIH